MESKTQAEMQDQTVSILPSRFVNTGLIGQGGMGSVFRARDSFLEREVAIKLLNVDSSVDDAAKQRFLQEAKALAVLDHKNIVKILGSDLTASGYPFHILELLEGESLASEIQKNGPLDASQFFNVMSQICAGLAHAHKNGIVHRDLKPSNVLLVKDIEDRTVVKIIDFGIARLSSISGGDSQNLTRTNTLLGSPAYMSPEQCRASKEIGAASDIYSLGCIMYESLTANPVFKSESPMELMYKHMNEPAPKLFEKATNDDLKRLSKLIERCLAKAPEERPENTTEISNELEKIFDKNPDLRGLKLNSRKRKRQLPLLVASTLALLVLAGGSTAFVLLQKHRTQEMPNVSRPKLNPEQQRELAELTAGIRNLSYQLSQAGNSGRYEILVPLVTQYCRLAELRFKTGNPAAAEKAFDTALQKCAGDSPQDKLLRARVYTEAARLHNSDRSEDDFQKALALVHDATGSICSADEFPLRKEMTTYHLNERQWDKCRADLQAIKTIWNANPKEPKFSEEEKNSFAEDCLRALHGKQLFVDDADRLGAIEYTSEITHFLVQQKQYHRVLSALRTCLEHAKGFRFSSPEFKKVAPPLYKDLIFVETEKGLTSDAKRHKDEYDRYFGPST